MRVSISSHIRAMPRHDWGWLVFARGESWRMAKHSNSFEDGALWALPGMCWRALVDFILIDALILCSSVKADKVAELTPDLAASMLEVKSKQSTRKHRRVLRVVNVKNSPASKNLVATPVVSEDEPRESAKEKKGKSKRKTTLSSNKIAVDTSFEPKTTENEATHIDNKRSDSIETKKKTRRTLKTANRKDKSTSAKSTSSAQQRSKTSTGASVTVVDILHSTSSKEASVETKINKGSRTRTQKNGKTSADTTDKKSDA